MMAGLKCKIADKFTLCGIHARCSHLPSPCSASGSGSGSAGPGSYSPKPELGNMRSASFSFGQRTTLRDPRAGLPGPGQYDHE